MGRRDRLRPTEGWNRLHQVGTALQFENDHVRVWEIRLGPGERGAFHSTTMRFVTVELKH